jgi:hypothetical protein
MIRVFVRNWWRWETNRHGMRELVPDPGARKYTIARVKTEDEARDICREYNAKHKPGKLSRKAEYTDD